MSSDEAALFESDKLFAMHILLRQWDEKAKLENKALPSLEKYRKMMIAQLQEGKV